MFYTFTFIHIQIKDTSHLIQLSYSYKSFMSRELTLFLNLTDKSKGTDTQEKISTRILTNFPIRLLQEQLQYPVN